MRLVIGLLAALVLVPSASAQSPRRSAPRARTLAERVAAKDEIRREGMARRVALAPAARVARAVYTVTSTANTDDGACTPDDCTLVEALYDASLADAAAEIRFAIGGGGAHQTIVLDEELPALDVPLLIDGDTQGCTDRQSGPCITIDGSGLPTDGYDIFFVLGDETEIRNLHFVGAGEPFYGDEDTFAAIDVLASDIVVAGCVIGGDRAGTTGNPDGEYASGDETGFVFGVAVFSVPEEGYVSTRNLIGGPEAADRNVILGNFIGVTIQDSPANTVQNNVLSENAVYGLGLNFDATDNVVVGNLVGLDATGTKAQPNEVSGMQVDNGGTGNRIGGPAAADRNVVSGNLGSGIVLTAVDYGPESVGDVTGNVVEGNYVGTDVTGLVAIPNGDANDEETGAGIALSQEPDQGAVEGNTIRGNLISGNLRIGILFEGDGTTGNVAVGNRIGLGSDGQTALPNGLAGVGARNGADDNRVGAETADASADRNTIAHHTVGAAAVGDVRGFDVAHNDFLDTALAVDLGLDGPTANDVGDADDGPNRLLNAPVIVSSSRDGGALVLNVTLDAPTTEATYPIRVTVYDASTSAGRLTAMPVGEFEIAASEAGQPVTRRIEGAGAASDVTVVATDADGNTGEFGAVAMVTAGEAGPSSATPSLRLDGPNPFRDGTSLSFRAAASGPVRVSVSDALGREIAVLHEGPVVAGADVRLRLDGAELAPGVYVVRAVEAGGRAASLVTVVRLR